MLRLDELPEDVVVVILLNLKPRDLGNVGNVCKRLRARSRCDRIWHEHCVQMVRHESWILEDTHEPPEESEMHGVIHSHGLILASSYAPGRLGFYREMYREMLGEFLLACGFFDSSGSDSAGEEGDQEEENGSS